MRKQFTKCIALFLSLILSVGLIPVTAAATEASDSTMTRGELVFRLHELRQKPDAETKANFIDVPAASEYADAVAWASEIGIIAGYGGGRFGPNDPITREQIAVVLHRYGQYMGFDLSAGEDTNILSYDDVALVSEWAIPAVQWACAEGVLKGIPTEDGNGMLLDPKGTVTEDQGNNMIFTMVGMSIYDIDACMDRENILQYHENVQVRKEDLEEDGSMHGHTVTVKDRLYYYQDDNGYCEFYDETDYCSLEGGTCTFVLGVLGRNPHPKRYKNPGYEYASSIENTLVVDVRVEDGKYYITTREENPQMALETSFPFIPYVEGMVYESRLVLDAETMLALSSYDVIISPDGTETVVYRTTVTYDVEIPDDINEIKSHVGQLTGDVTEFTIVENPGTPEETTYTKNVLTGDSIWFFQPDGAALFADYDCTVLLGYEAFSTSPGTIYVAYMQESPVDVEALVEANSLESILSRYDSMEVNFPDVGNRMYFDDQYIFGIYADGSENLYADGYCYCYYTETDEFYAWVQPGADMRDGFSFPFLQPEYLIDYYVSDAETTENGLLIHLTHSYWAARDMLEKLSMPYEKTSYIVGEYLLDPETYVILSYNETVVQPDGTSYHLEKAEFSYNAEKPEGLDALRTRMQPEENNAVLELVLFPGTENEETFRYCGTKGDWVGINLENEYNLFFDEACNHWHGDITSVCLEQDVTTLYVSDKPVINMDIILEANSRAALVERFGSAAHQAVVNGMAQNVYADERFVYVDSGEDMRYLRTGDTGCAYYGEHYLLVSPELDTADEFSFLFMREEDLRSYYIYETKLTDDGLIVYLRMTEEDTENTVTFTGQEYVEDSRFFCTLLLNSETYEIIRMTEQLVLPDETEIYRCETEFTYGVQCPADAQELYQHLTAGENSCAFTLVVSPGTDNEKTYTYTAQKGDKLIVAGEFVQMYDFYSDAACTKSIDLSAAVLDGDLTVYAVLKSAQ